ncbi:transposase [Bradyrhizobium sp. USDA 372]|uniref:Transposase n=1 Tax=Bradyrhizobium yuanmingense TaxID=108015 RepID=A0A1C3XJW6_9BRAD|nr:MULTISPECIES: IS21 family transposase [Bradyrhizobium]TWI17284.1 transposase [Bradyrhizobium yuanmingense]SCB52567.1 Transposase [Bradyrhizobium yuanmingense]
MARLGNRRFFSLAVLNEAIHALLVDLNNRPLWSWARSRRELFEELDRPALTPLPDEPYESAEWKRCRVNLEYHVELAKHDYSVPHNLVHEEVEARITLKAVESFLRGKRVASRLRSTLPHRPTTIDEHMPSSHRRYRDWAHERIRSEAAKVRPEAETLIDVILRSRPHPEQGFRSAIGILGLVRRYGEERVDAACARALLLNARCYKSVAAILKNAADKTAPPAQEAPVLFHANIRSRSYYN